MKIFQIMKYYFYNQDRKDISLPGAKKVDSTKRNKKIAMMVKSVAFSQNGKYWGAVSPEGLHIFSSEIS